MSDELTARAARGEPRAMAVLGRQLLTGEGGRASPLEGLSLLQRAALTEGDAAALLSYAHALGVCMPRDPDRGVELPINAFLTSDATKASLSPEWARSV